MKLWQRGSLETDFGPLLLIWRHRAAGRFYSKIFSWLLGGFVLGLLASITFNAIGLGGFSLSAGRITFFVVFILGVVSAFFRNLAYGLDYRITQKALLHVRPLCGIERLRPAGGKLRKGDRIDYLPWEEIKSVNEAGGALALTLKEGQVVELGVDPVLALWLPTPDGGMEKRTSAQGGWKSSAELDKEAHKLIVQKIRDLKKNTTAKN